MEDDEPAPCEEPFPFEKSSGNAEVGSAVDDQSMLVSGVTLGSLILATHAIKAHCILCSGVFLMYENQDCPTSRA